MKLPINWLKEYIKIPTDTQELISKLTSIGHMQDGPAKEIAGDLVYDLEIRQNRSDCLSIIGLAREAGAVLNQKVTYPQLLDLPEISNETQVEIVNPELCYRFETIKLDEIKIGQSPEWLQKRLEAYGVKAINNIVDITNYVMIEYGEPMHAYDTREIEGMIQIRNAKNGERVTILGGKEITLTQDDLVIADEGKVLSLAGLIGGAHSGVKEDTTSIILEDATYNQASIRRSSLRHSVRTEASTRHEKFLHPKLTTIALQRAAQLFVEITGAKIINHTDNFPQKMDDKKISLYIDNLNRLGGIEISSEKSKEILTKLEISSEPISDDGIEAEIPYFRTDLEQEADLIEEVLRIYGYDNIPDHLPYVPSPKNIDSKFYTTEETIRDIMVSCGFNEQITEPLTHEIESKLTPIVLENSLNSDKTMLRTTLKNNLLKSLENQKKYRKKDISLFEIGKIYFKDNEEYKEERMLGALLSSKSSSYSQMKGIIETLYERLGKKMPNKISIEQLDSTPTYFFEIKTEPLISEQRDTTKILTSPPQVILQDLSFVVPMDTKVGELIDIVKETSQLIYKIQLGENPKKIDENSKSVFLNIAFNSSNKTITNEQVEPERKKIIQTLENTFKAKIR